MTTIMDVIVVGCGASGIAALRKLHDAGLKVIGLEAADRIGGRIHTTKYGAASIDLGACWCEGDKNNAVMDLAGPLNLLERELPSHTWFVLSNGDLVPDDVGKDIINQLSAAVDNADKEDNKTVSECIWNASKTNNILKRDPKLTQSFLEWFEMCNQAGQLSEPRKGKSLKGVEDCKVDKTVLLNWKGKGYETILNVLLNKHPDPTKQIPVQILLNKEVESIKWRPSQSGLEPGNPLVHLTCKDGSLYAAKSIIVTLSIGVLKEKHSQLFNPPLPSDKVNFINTMQMCLVNKIYIEFDKPWWPKTPANFTILWREEDKERFTKEEQWITGVFGLDTVAYQPNLLLAWIYGENAEKMEHVSENNVKAVVEKFFQLMLQKHFNVAPIKSILRTCWSSNHLARGTYAYRTVATDEIGGNAVSFSQPLYYSDDFPILCFAGEATSHEYHSTVHGAVEAGFREAERLIQSFKNK